MLLLREGGTKEDMREGYRKNTTDEDSTDKHATDEKYTIMGVSL